MYQHFHLNILNAYCIDWGKNEHQFYGTLEVCNALKVIQNSPIWQQPPTQHPRLGKYL